ncbi:Spo0B domain-containing protein [Pasteuria penetrans]|uniref:Spo0B domain-containing protein n=1 Tax=Pasteuria penetrans TaxID=86005 RepID=UPI001CAA472F|nr:Spo0B domain-containing protein [Pasteuria penetrans]
MGSLVSWLWVAGIGIVLLVTLGFLGVWRLFQRWREEQVVSEAETIQNLINHCNHALLNDLQVLLGYHQLGKGDKLVGHLKSMMDRERRDQVLMRFSYPPLAVLLLHLERGLSLTRIQLVIDPWLQRLAATDGRRVWKVLEGLRTDFLVIVPQWLVLRLGRRGRCVRIHITIRGMNDVQALRDCVVRWRRMVRFYRGSLVWEEKDRVLWFLIPLSDDTVVLSSDDKIRGNERG